VKSIQQSRLLLGMMRAFDALRARDHGATATEYAILVGFIAIVIVAGITVFGNQLNNFFSTMAAQLP